MEDFCSETKSACRGLEVLTQLSCLVSYSSFRLGALCQSLASWGTHTHVLILTPPLHLKSGKINASVCDIGLWGWWDCVTPSKCEDEHVTLESLCVLANLSCLRSCFIVGEEQKTGLRLLITLRQHVSCTLMGKGMVTKRSVYYICSGSDIFVFLSKLSQSCPLCGKGGQLWS